MRGSSWRAHPHAHTPCRYPDDPDFHPLRELVHLPLCTHIRRLLTSLLLYVMLVFLCCHLPAKISIWLCPSLVPLHVRFSDPTEMPADLLLFNFCAPFALDQLQIRNVSLKFVEC